MIVSQNIGYLTINYVLNVLDSKQNCGISDSIIEK